MATLLNVSETEVRAHRHGLNLHPVYKRVDTCAAEFATDTAYMYSTYEEECEAQPSDRKKIMILDGGQTALVEALSLTTAVYTRLWLCVKAALKPSWSTVTLETVSTDFDTSDRLYFEPLTLGRRVGNREGRTTLRFDRALRWPNAIEIGQR